MTTTNINIRISQSPTRRARTARRHVSIPHTALWTQDWWAAQADPSASVRELISEDIRAHGISDVLNRANAQAAASAAAGATPFLFQFPTGVASPAAVPTPFGPPTAPAATQAATAAAAPAAEPRDAVITALRGQMSTMLDMLTALVLEEDDAPVPVA